MLILGRFEGEQIIIGDNIILKVLEIRRNKVRIAIMAPEEVVILRGEVLGKEGREASKGKEKENESETIS